MFYFENFRNKKILKSTLLDNINVFFTTREFTNSDIENITERVISPTQTHSDNVVIVNESETYEDTDALILTQKNTTIYLRFADCTPIIFYDKSKNIGAITHAGWRGTAKKIGIKTIEKMHNELGVRYNDVIAIIGPAISLCCYEVSTDVKNELLSTVYNKDGLYSGNNVDLKKINARQLEELGIKNIDICPYCTSCNNDLFYSFRKENGTKQRHFAVLFL